MSEHVEHEPVRVPRAGLRKKLAVGAVLTVVASIAGLAFAEWLASGDGEGYARSRTAAPLTTESATASESLYPGGSGDLTLQIHNPNPFPVTVTSVTPNGPITSDDPACDAAGHGVTFGGVTGLALSIPAESSASFTLTDAVTMSLDSANECQGALFTIPVSLNGGSGGGSSQTFYADADGDGYGDPNNTVQDEMAPAGYTTDGTDCDDSNPAANPGAPEVIGDAVDNNCDGAVDEGGITFYADADGDGYGDPSTATLGGMPPAGYTTDGTDCDDSDPATHPGAVETFDGVDNDCDGVVDDNAVGGILFYADADGDGYGDPSNAILGGMAPTGYVTDGTDCDDTNPAVHPGAIEISGDGLDNDCDGVVDG